MNATGTPQGGAADPLKTSPSNPLNEVQEGPTWEADTDTVTLSRSGLKNVIADLCDVDKADMALEWLRETAATPSQNPEDERDKDYEQGRFDERRDLIEEITGVRIGRGPVSEEVMQLARERFAEVSERKFAASQEDSHGATAPPTREGSEEVSEGASPRVATSNYAATTWLPALNAILGIIAGPKGGWDRLTGFNVEGIRSDLNRALNPYFVEVPEPAIPEHDREPQADGPKTSANTPQSPPSKGLKLAAEELFLAIDGIGGYMSGLRIHRIETAAAKLAALLEEGD